MKKIVIFMLMNFSLAAMAETKPYDNQLYSSEQKAFFQGARDQRGENPCANASVFAECMSALGEAAKQTVDHWEVGEVPAGEDSATFCGGATCPCGGL